MSYPQHKITSPAQDYELKKDEPTLDNLKPDDPFCHAVEFNVSRLQTLNRLRTRIGQQVVCSQSPLDETVVLFRRQKRHRTIAQLLKVLLTKHPMAIT